jgi:hypothetical protein
VNPVAHTQLVIAYLSARLRLGERSEDGLTTTEIAVLTLLLVGGALAVGAIIVRAAKSNADAIPDPAAPTP